SLPVMMATVAVAGFFSGPVLPALFAVRQRHAGSALLAQVSMTGASLKIGAYSLGAVLGGWVVPELGARAAIAAVAAGQLAAAGTEHRSPTSMVKIHYTGWTTDGKMFDSSVQRKKPAMFPVNAVIPGFSEGLQLMTVGEKRRLWIPGPLAYDDSPRPGAPKG